MSPSHVLEPTYDALKRRLMEGSWLPGTRLEATRLAFELGVSITPVRDSLNRLVGERLIASVPGEGFRVLHWTEQELRDVLDLNLALLLAAISGSTGLYVPPAEPGTDHASQTAALFTSIASVSANGEVVDAIRSVNDRLHPLRRLDETLIPDARRELEAIEHAFALGGWRDTARDLLVPYHDARKQVASRYVAMMARRAKP